MKTTLNLKTTLVLLNIVLADVLLVLSCNNPQNVNDNPNIAEQHGLVKPDTSTNMDAQFLVKVAQINIEEIKLGQLAEQNGTMADVKDLGKMMADDHQKAEDELAALAMKKSVTIPSSPDKDADDAYSKLSNESGKDFDRDFCDMMVSGHKDAIALFEKESTVAQDTAVRQFASSTLPTLHKHLDHATACQEKCKKAM